MGCGASGQPKAPGVIADHTHDDDISKQVDFHSIVRDFELVKQELRDAKQEIADLKIREQEATKLHHLYRPERIILLRHGESEANVDPAKYGPSNCPDADKSCYGDPNVQLTEEGIQQAMEAGDRLAAQIGDRPVLCFVSPYRRTRQTADAVLGRLAAAGVRVLDRREDPRLREREFCGTFQREGPRRDDEWAYSRFFWRPPSGESCADVYDRITTFLETLWRLMRALPALEGGVVLVVSHGLTNRIFAMRWLRWSPEQLGRTRNPGNCQPIVLESRPAPPGGRPSYRLTDDSLRVLGIDADQPPPPG